MNESERGFLQWKDGLENYDSATKREGIDLGVDFIFQPKDEWMQKEQAKARWKRVIILSQVPPCK